VVADCADKQYSLSGQSSEAGDLLFEDKSIMAGNRTAHLSDKKLFAI